MLPDRLSSQASVEKDSLSRSFVRILLLYQAIQIAIFLAYALPKGFVAGYALPFAVVSLPFHALLLVMLTMLKQYFIVEHSQRRLERINRANSITLFRLSTLPTIVIILLASKDYRMQYELLALVALVFATDFLDGFVSRRDKETTSVGKMLDSSSDYALLFAISVVFYYFHIIPVWFLALLTLRLGGQAVMMMIVLAVKKRVTPRTSIMGKATVAATMALYVFELLRYVADLPRLAYRAAEVATGLIVAVSIADKILIMTRDLKAGPILPATEK